MREDRVTFSKPLKSPTSLKRSPALIGLTLLLASALTGAAFAQAVAPTPKPKPRSDTKPEPQPQQQQQVAAKPNPAPQREANAAAAAMDGAQRVVPAGNFDSRWGGLQ